MSHALCFDRIHDLSLKVKTKWKEPWDAHCSKRREGQQRCLQLELNLPEKNEHKQGRADLRQ